MHEHVPNPVRAIVDGKLRQLRREMELQRESIERLTLQLNTESLQLDCLANEAKELLDWLNAGNQAPGSGSGSGGYDCRTVTVEHTFS
jgi:hypothetical protein